MKFVNRNVRTAVCVIAWSAILFPACGPEKGSLGPGESEKSPSGFEEVPSAPSAGPVDAKEPLGGGSATVESGLLSPDGEAPPDEPNLDAPPSPSGAVCGNGQMEEGEACDDGNIVSADGCSSTCQIEPSGGGSIWPKLHVGPICTIRRVAGSYYKNDTGDGYLDGIATESELNIPSSVAVDDAGNIFIADQHWGLIHKVDSNGILNTIEGAADTSDPKRTLCQPRGIRTAAAGSLLIADFCNAKVYELKSNGDLTSIAGKSHVEGPPFATKSDGVSPLEAWLEGPHDIAFDEQRQILYISDNDFLHDNTLVRVRKVADGLITTVAGTGQKGYSGDGGPAKQAKLSAPGGLAVDKNGSLYIVDGARLRKVDLNGTITTIAGTGIPGFSGDLGPAGQAQLKAPRGIDIDKYGNIYIADDDRIRKISTDGKIRTIAGGGNVPVSVQSPDVPALQADLPFVTDVSIGANGRILFTTSSGGNIPYSESVYTVVCGPP